MAGKEFKKKKNYSVFIGICIMGVLLLFLLTAIVYHPYQYDEMNKNAKLMAPSLQHWFGCDNFGRDIFIRVQCGVGMTFLIALSAVFIGSVAGTLFGAFAGYYGGLGDKIFMRINDVLFAFPSILLALLIISIFGGGTSRVIIALGIAIIPSFAKMMRGEFIQQRNKDYVYLAKLMGVSNLRIIFVHILPNTFPVLKSCILIAFNNAVLAEAGMSYLGIGVQPPTASLGRMLSEAQTYLRLAPWYTVYPGLTMILLILAITLLGESNNRNKLKTQWKLVRSKAKPGEKNATGS